MSKPHNSRVKRTQGITGTNTPNHRAQRLRLEMQLAQGLPLPPQNLSSLTYQLVELELSMATKFARESRLELQASSS